MSAIDWRCQSCGWLWCLTYTVKPDEPMGDPPCNHCIAGCTMNAEPFCHLCGQPLKWGTNLCEHQQPEPSLKEAEVYDELVHALDLLAQARPRKLIIQSYSSGYLDVSSSDGRTHYRLTAKAASGDPPEFQPTGDVGSREGDGA